jgi:hypothetical protein
MVSVGPFTSIALLGLPLSLSLPVGSHLDSQESLLGLCPTLPLTITMSGMCAKTSFTGQLFHCGARGGRTHLITTRKEYPCPFRVGSICAFDQGLPSIGGILLAVDFVFGPSFPLSIFMYILCCSAGSGLPLLCALNLFRRMGHCTQSFMANAWQREVGLYRCRETFTLT